MATRNSEIVEAFEKFFQNYYDNEVKQLAQEYPNEKQGANRTERYCKKFIIFPCVLEV
ncbi:hypothetical protein [Halostagnicola sp. A56]|uniref:hypothetical protein n=1 Tax=Halostagnicola sp. A56 TaxID=1495067 RepID=UPI0012E2A2D3|nr:hypothetical protein [Halostagnicola sp. A56]